MKKCLYLSILLFCLFSCELVLLENPAPGNGELLTSFPEVFRGKYMINGPSSEDSFVEIGENYIHGTGHQLDYMSVDEWYISDSLLVKRLGSDIVLNFKYEVDSSVFFFPLILSSRECGFLKGISFTSGGTEEDLENDSDPILITKYNARLLSSDGYEMIYLISADSAKLQQMKNDRLITQSFIYEKHE